MNAFVTNPNHEGLDEMKTRATKLKEAKTGSRVVDTLADIATIAFLGAVLFEAGVQVYKSIEELRGTSTNEKAK